MALVRATDPLTIFPRLSLAAQITLPELHDDQPDNLCYRPGVGGHIGSVYSITLDIGWGHPMAHMAHMAMRICMHARGQVHVPVQSEYTVRAHSAAQ